MLIKRKYPLMEGEGGGEGKGGGGDDAAKKAAEEAAEAARKAAEEAKNKGGGDDALKKMREQLDALEAKNKELLKEKKDAAKKAEEAALEAARKGGDIEALEKSWQEKLNKVIEEKDTALAQYQSMIHALTVGATASKLAGDIALPGSSDVLLPHIQQRLTVETHDGKPTVRVLDKEGKPTAMSIEELRTEFMANPAFAPIIAGSKAQGSGKPAGQGGGQGGKQLYRDEMDATQKMEYQREHGQQAYLALPKSRAAK